MIAIETVFWMFVIVFCFIGFVRGWAREVLVTASVILAYFIIYVMLSVGLVKNFLQAGQVPDSNVITIQQFWFQVILLLLLVFFGYETPSIPRLAGNRFKRDNFRDSALGFIMGGFNGYMILGSLWAFLGQANYPGDFIIQQFSQEAIDLYNRLPPTWLMQSPTILIAVILAFLFLIIVFV
jgi:uncharacterized membrane protein required for colicin V production